MTAPLFVSVFSPEGVEEKHLRANARDLVNGSGYSWMRGLKSQPNHPASFGGQPRKAGSISQEILDKVGGKGDAPDNNAELEAEVARQANEIAQMRAAAAKALAEQEAASAPVAAPVAAEASAEIFNEVLFEAPAVLDFTAPAVADDDDAALEAAIAAEEAEIEAAPVVATRKRGGRSVS